MKSQHPIPEPTRCEGGESHHYEIVDKGYCTECWLIDVWRPFEFVRTTSQPVDENDGRNDGRRTHTRSGAQRMKSQHQKRKVHWKDDYDLLIDQLSNLLDDVCDVRLEPPIDQAYEIIDLLADALSKIRNYLYHCGDPE